MITSPVTLKPAEFSLDLKYTQQEGTIYLTGTHALVRLLLDQHHADRRRGLNTATFLSGYPGSPLGGLDLELARQGKLLKEHQVHFLPAVNEDTAATAMHGSQMLHCFPGAKYDGVVGVWFGKGPGIDRTGDAFRHGNLFGVGKNGGVLALAGDDPTAKSSTIPSDFSAPLFGLGMPILYPGSVQEILDLGLHGIPLSRASGLWVALRIVTNVADGASTAEVAPDRINPVIPTLMVDGRLFEPAIDIKSTGTPLILETERRLHTERLELARLYARENRLNQIVVPTPDAWLGIMAAGKTYYDLRQALDELGLSDAALRSYGIRILKMGLIFPLETRIVREFASGLREILVVEEKRPFLEMFARDALYSLADRPLVVGKNDEEGGQLLPVQGELDSDLIARAVARRLGRRMTVPSVEARIRQLDEARQRPTTPALPRLPHFCSGCPHNRSLLAPEGSIVGAGIGCHSLTIYMDPSHVGTNIGMTHMGGEGAQWAGLAPFTDMPHLTQNMGDGTFFHSGSLAIRYAVTAGVNITYKILYNHVVAMTGGQNPSGSLSVPNMTRLLEAEGVKKIIVTTDDLPKYKGVSLAKIAEVRHRDRLLEAMATLVATPGVTVLIHDQYCATEARRRRRRGLLADPPRRIYINERVCEGCGDCAKKSNCLSVWPVDTEFGRKVRIDQSSCNKDYSCLLGDCPAFLTIEGVEEPAQRDHQPLPDLALPEPALRVPAEGFKLYMMGIGGTGVVTVNQILGTAAMLDGKRVRGLDQTGLAQKGGPVVSHLKISSDEMELSNNVATGEADLYLAFDLLVATQPVHLAKADPARTVAVVSTSQIPTGKMVVNTGLHFPTLASCLGEIERVTRKDDSFFLDARGLAEALFGDHLAANNILLGAAYQLGGVPLSATSIEQAIRLNGVAVESNLAAFRWGRLAVDDPRRVEDAVRQATKSHERSTGACPPLPDSPPGAVLHPGSYLPHLNLSPGSEASAGSALPAEVRQLVESVGATGETLRLLEVRLPELIDYHDASYARQYAEFVKQVKRAEEAKTPGRSAITEAVVRYLFKLMAYKDEYEVARLHLDPGFQAELRARFGDQSRFAWHLTPPIRRGQSPKGKVRLGIWFAPGLRALRGLRRLRGTSFDVFGRSEIRRAERALIDEYRQMVATALDKLSGQNYGTVLAIAALPEDVRGYGQIKLASVERYRKEASQLLANLT